MSQSRFTRRGFLGLGGAAVGLGIASRTGQTEPGEAAWPASGRNWRNPGFTGSSTIPGSPVVEWQTSLEEGIETSPVAAYGLVVVPSGGTLYAVDSRTGELVWTSEATEYADQSAAFANGTVVAGGDALVALDRASGEPQWRTELDARTAGPVVPVYQLLYVPTDDGRVRGFDPESGEELWAVSPGSGLPRTPVEDPARAFLTAGDAISAYDRRSGERQWKTPVPGTVVGSPVLTSDAVVVGTSEALAVGVGFDGEVSWRVELGSPPLTTPALWGGSYPLFQTGSRFRTYVARDDRFLDFPIDETPVTAPVIADAVVYGVDSGGLTVSGQDGVRWQLPLGRAPTSRPALAYDTVFFGDDAGTLTAVTGEDGIAAASDPVTPTPEPTPTSRPPTQANSFFGDERRQVSLPMETLVGGGGLLAGGTLLALLWSRRAGTDDGEGDGTGSTMDDTDDGTGGGAGTTTGGTTSSGRRQTGSDNGAGRSNRSSSPDPSTDRGATTGSRTDSGSRSRTTSGSRSRTTSGSNRPRDGSKRRSPTASGENGDASTAFGGGDSPLDTSNGGERPEDVPDVESVSLSHEEFSKERPLGSGGNADVYLATTAVDGRKRQIAVKEPRIEGTLHVETAERLLREAETWSALDDHDHVVGLLDWGSDPLPWIAMEYMDGGQLGERIQGPSYFERLWIAYGIVSAVRHAHRSGVAHLDLKPANVLFRETPDGTWDVPKVADWGLSKRLLDHSTTVEGLSPAYAAPEQFDDAYGSTDEVTDVYQTGAILYELFTGRPPFQGEATQVMRQVLQEEPPAPSSVNPELPAELEEMILNALVKDRTDRYDSMVYLRDDLREVVTRVRE